MLQTLVAEVYGPITKARSNSRRRSRRSSSRRRSGGCGLVRRGPADQVRPASGSDKAALHGISPADVTRTLQVGLSGASAGLLARSAVARGYSDRRCGWRGPIARASRTWKISNCPLLPEEQIALQEVTNLRQTTIDTSVYHKNLQPVIYVTGDVAGGEESPVYAIMKMSDAIDKIKLPAGLRRQAVQRHDHARRTDRYSMKWDGEWHITVEVFRDLGLAFAAVLVLIYVLVVGWFRSFITPLIIMAPIPLTLVGILPAHALMGAFFTATSMIGFIAGAGIIVRNSIILVDFIELRRSQGMPLEEAVVDAGAVRFRPMLLTAAAVVVGASVILFDPIFQGLAISLMAGEVASTVLSRMAVPVLYYLSERRHVDATPPQLHSPESTTTVAA